MAADYDVPTRASIESSAWGSGGAVDGAHDRTGGPVYAAVITETGGRRTEEISTS